MVRRFLASGIAHPNLPKPDKFNANLENDAEKERLAKGLAGMILLHEHDGRTRIGKVLRGYVPKEGRHKGAVVAEFEVTDPEYQERIKSKQLRELSLGQKTTEFSSVFVPKGVVKTEFEELSVVEKGAMPNGPVITDFEIWDDESGERLTHRVLASMKSGAIYDGSPHDVETKIDEKMTEQTPAQTTAAPATTTPAPAVPAQTTPTQTPIAVPAQTTPAPTQTAPAQTTPPTPETTPADDEEIKTLMEASQALANEAKSRGMKLADYLKQRDALTAEAERISRERAEAEAAENKRHEELMMKAKMDDFRKRFQTAMVDPEFRKIDRTTKLEELKPFEERYLKGDLTMEDKKYVDQMVLASQRVEASKSSGYADYTQQITQSKEERMRQIARDALQNATQKSVQTLAPVGTVSDGFDHAPEPTRMTKRPLPSSVTVTASAKNSFVSSTFDLPPGAELDWGVLAPTDESTMAAEKELAKETKVFASAKSFPLYDDAEVPDTPPDHLMAMYGLASTQVWASNKPKKPRYGLPDDVKADLRQKMPKPKPGMTKRDSVFVRGNPALVFAMQNYPDFFNNVLRSGAEPPKHDLDVVTPEIRKKYLWKADTPENQQQYRAEGIELRDYFSSGLNPGQHYKPLEHVAAPLAVPFATPETKRYQWPQ